jgi:hypothetical protein
MRAQIGRSWLCRFRPSWLWWHFVLRREQCRHDLEKCLSIDFDFDFDFFFLFFDSNERFSRLKLSLDC